MLRLDPRAEPDLLGRSLGHQAQRLPVRSVRFVQAACGSERPAQTGVRLGQAGGLKRLGSECADREAVQALRLVVPRLLMREVRGDDAQNRPCGSVLGPEAIEIPEAFVDELLGLLDATAPSQDVGRYAARYGDTGPRAGPSPSATTCRRS